MVDEDWAPVSVVYLSPIRALLNNQEQRVADLAGMVGRRAFKWHGDVGAGQRTAFVRDPTDILLITPESIEAMLLTSKTPARELFAGLRAVIVDEIHAFADDDRGAHLSALLERLTRYASRDVQRIGLSATVGNPPEILRWVQGSSERAARVVDPGGARAIPELSVDYVASLENAAKVVRALHPGKKRLVFTDSRQQAEALGQRLAMEGVLTYIIHGSLSLSARRDAERAFAEERDCVIVATSALELGIDVGDLDHVLQIDAPGTVSSFLQRMGRSGRRGGPPNCTFLTTREDRLLQAMAIVRLFREGFVEPVHPSARASHVLAHQILSLAIQHGGIAPDDFWPWLEGAAPFEGLTAEGAGRARPAHDAPGDPERSRRPALARRARREALRARQLPRALRRLRVAANDYGAARQARDRDRRRALPRLAGGAGQPRELHPRWALLADRRHRVGARALHGEARRGGQDAALVGRGAAPRLRALPDHEARPLGARARG
ncbi:MAG: helicase-related protein [Sandaracinaceae bacterium]|nr:helicase-related protein [Sandaracinaceae bacterium]